MGRYRFIPLPENTPVAPRWNGVRYALHRFGGLMSWANFRAAIWLTVVIFVAVNYGFVSTLWTGLVLAMILFPRPRCRYHSPCMWGCRTETQYSEQQPQGEPFDPDRPYDFV